MGAKIPAKQITSWSFTRYSDYKLCPLKAKLKHIDKIKEPPNPAMARGAEVHDKAEAFIKGKLKQIPPELKSFADDFKNLRKLYAKRTSNMVVEDTWVFTKDWDQTTWDDWIHCWVRIKLDCALHEDDTTLIVNDWKTGKFRPEKNEEYLEQLELYGLAAFLVFPHVQRVKPKLIYLDEATVFDEDAHGEELVFHRSQLDDLKKLWAKRVRPMLNDKRFAPRPNNLCSWCFFRKSNKAAGGGQCRY